MYGISFYFSGPGHVSVPSEFGWLQSTILTLIDLMRDLHVERRQLSWVTLPEHQRRLVYRDVMTRIVANTRGEMTPFEMERFLDVLMVRDDELSPLGGEFLAHTSR